MCHGAKCSNNIDCNADFELNDIQTILFDFIDESPSVSESELCQYKRAIKSFNTDEWDGRLDSLIRHFESCFGDVPNIFLVPEFDIIIIRIRIIWEIRFEPVCASLVPSLNDLVDINGTTISLLIPVDCSFQWNDTIIEDVYFFIDDAKLTFEFIQFRDWLRWIGCPWSLIYRISRSFYFRYSITAVSIEIYQVNLRRFVLNELRGFVSDFDFGELEAQMLGSGFGLMLQRMWAFRGFKLGGIPRMWCGAWFWAWRSYGFSYDITFYTGWWDFPELGSFGWGDFPDFNFGTWIVPAPSYDYIQQCLLDYLTSPAIFVENELSSTERNELSELIGAVGGFISDDWTGTFDNLLDMLREITGFDSELLLRSQFDLTLVKMFIFWDLRSQTICEESVQALIDIPFFDDITIGDWLSGCNSISVSWNYTILVRDLYFFRDDDDQTFEFITLRNWLIDIGCPWSLIYRISRAFYFRWNFSITGMGSYLIEVRNFIFRELRPFVSDFDFQALEVGLFGGDFGFVLQRMWSFRGFRLGGIPRMWCGAWFWRWYSYGWRYDITTFTGWGDFDFTWNGWGAFPDFDFDGFIVPAPGFDNVQQCMVDYFRGFLGGDVDTFRYSLLILSFDTDGWDGTFNAITDLFKSEFGEVPSTLFLPDFDSVLTKMWILFKIRGQNVCQGAIDSLAGYDVINGDVLTSWLTGADWLAGPGCATFNFDFGYSDIQTSLFFFRPDSELTFEFISLRDWLIWIGCPMSLVYRISWWFYWDFNFSYVDMADYQIRIRQFIFGRLRGFVSDYDFGQLELALFGEGFGFILQRMWAFRGFRLAGIDRAMCFGWWGFWRDYGYSYDITGFTNWDFNGVGWGWPSGFNFNGFVVSVPQFDWTLYFSGWRLRFYYWLITWNVDYNFYIALNSLPSYYTTRFEIENYFLKRLGFTNGCWADGRSMFAADSFVPIFRELTGVTITPGYDLPDSILEDVFNPLQMVLNNWVQSIEWLSSKERYEIQLAIGCFTDTGVEAIFNFYSYLQAYFGSSCGFSSDFINRFNWEFTQIGWSITITRWRIVAMCIGWGFPWRIIYGSLRMFFDFGWTAFDIDWVYRYVLIGPWYINIDGIDFNPVFDPFSFNDVQQCLVNYIEDFVSDANDLFSYKNAINNFDIESWDGSFNGIVANLDEYMPTSDFGRFLYKPGFDAVLTKMYLLWELRSFTICGESLTALNGITSFNQAVIDNWLAGCSSISYSFDWPAVQNAMYFFRADDDLTFEFITLRSWLIDIGCPMSLIWRISRAFYFRWNYDITSIGSYLYEVRNFLVVELRGFVFDFDFQALEVALFGGDFGFILQRMWVFRGFRIGGIPRMWCGAWFWRWYSFGWRYDISTFTAWGDFDFTWNGWGDFPDFNPTGFIVSAPGFDNVQQCMIDYFYGFIGMDALDATIDTFRYSLLVTRFNTADWDGSFNAITELFKTEFGEVPSTLFLPAFDSILTKMWIFWNLRGQTFCDGAVEQLSAYDVINGDVLSNWLGSCPQLTFNYNFGDIQTSLYYFRADTDLTFEFISLRDWLIWIGCPMSLVYRISWWFYWDFDFTYTGIADYQIRIRQFIFGRLRGFVSDYDFEQLELAVFGDGFGFILQRMWAFRGFRLAGVNRAMCLGWFNFWISFGYDYDITGFTNWDFDGVGWTWPSGFDFNGFIVSVPQFDWTLYFTGWRLVFYRWLITWDVDYDFFIALNSLPSSVTTRFEIENYFLKRLGIGNPCWSTGREIFASNDFIPVFESITGLTVAPGYDLSPSLLEDVFTPLQMVLNNWVTSISWLSDKQVYELQLAIACFTDTSFGAIYSFYLYLQDYFGSSCGYDVDFVNRFNLEFTYTAWSITITRWQIVAMCVGFGFPWRIIYGSLGFFFDLGFEPGSLNIEWVTNNVLVAPWNFEIDGVVSFEPVFPYTFNSVQQCLVDYIEGLVSNLGEVFRYQAAINAFDIDLWDGSFNKLVSALEAELPNENIGQYLFKPEFDAVLVKMNILWELRTYTICESSLTSLNSITAFNQEILSGWLSGCDSIDISLDLNFVLDRIYFFIDIEQLDFEFITLRRWLINIGCPMSLIWRISRSFYYRFNYSYSSIAEYQYQVRRFIFAELRGFVSDFDFADLEGALFGGDFGFILQRMWAFRGFKLAGVPRMWCGAWFNFWNGFSVRYDITTFTGWSDFDLEGGFDWANFPSFSFDDFIVWPPRFDFGLFFTGFRLNLYNFFNSRISVSFIREFAIALNSLPETFTTRFEFETYFIKRVVGSRFITTGWSYGDVFSDQALYDAADVAISADASPVPNELLESVFTPMQMVLNNWATSLGLQDSELYGLQIAIRCFESTQLDGYNLFYGYIQRFFVIWGFSGDFIANFGSFWSGPAWAVTITRWQIVGSCVGMGFPRDIIYGSLGLFFDLGFDASLLTFEWVTSTVLVGRWAIPDLNVDFDIVFNVDQAFFQYRYVSENT